MASETASQAFQRQFNDAVAFHRTGKLREAEQLYQTLIHQMPQSPAPRHMLGVLCMSQGRAAEAADLFGAALKLDPGNAETLTNHGHALRACGRMEEAVAAYDKSLSIHLPQPVALISRGIAQRQLQRLEEALASFDKALALTPNDPGIWLNRGVLLLDLKRFDQALAAYDEALKRNPQNAWALNNRGQALAQMGRPQDAVASFAAALAIHPDHWEALNNQGLAQVTLQRLDEAQASFTKALAINPGNPDILCNRGSVLSDLGRFEDALVDFDAALAIHPHHAATLNNRGLALSQLGRGEDSLASFDAALKSDPNDTDALGNRARQLLQMDRWREAQAGFESVLAIDPDNDNAFGGLAQTALSACDWPLVAKITPQLQAAILAGRSAVPPLHLFGYSDDPALHLQSAVNHVKASLPVRHKPLWNGTPNRNSRIKITYLSPDFREHPTSHLIAGLIEAHDRDRFEVSAISLGPDDASPMRARMIQAFDHFTDARRMSDRDIALQLAREKTDIAIDLAGHTQNARLDILAFRPAPVQVNYLGYPGSMGADFIDYILADEIVAPQQQFFSEKLVHLPDCYQVNDTKRAIAATAPTRQQAGLPEKSFVFCCFNNGWKITAPFFQTWMRLLEAVPGSALWLLDTGVNQTLRQQASQSGIDPNRLVFAPRQPADQHLARHRLADLFLDTAPYNAHTTASDALWAGLPLVTAKGAAFPARVAASLLHAVDLDELVTENLEDYEALALKLARDPATLNSIRAKLANNRLTQPLFDTGRFRRAIEAAYIQMHARAERGEAPQSFRV